MTKYTFLLPAYKKHFLDKALHSIQSQTYTDLKVIISDDCSPENLHCICEPYLEDPRFSYRRNEKNIGSKNLVTHWNLLLKETDAEFIIMASDDDVYHMDFLKTIDVLQQKYPDVDLLRARIQHINEDGEVTWKEKPSDEYQNPIEAICECPDTCVPNYVFRRSKLLEMGGFVNLPYAMGSDTVTAMEMSRNGVANTCQVLFNYRLSDNQISCHSNDLKEVKQEKLTGLFATYDYCMKLVQELDYPDTPLNHKIIEDYKYKITTALPHLTMKYVSSLGLNQLWRTYKLLCERKCFMRKLQKIEYICSFFY